MSRLTEKLNYILNSTADIKAAIESKGINMTDVKFSEYANKILEISYYKIPIVNPDAETGDMTGWTIDMGDIKVIANGDTDHSAFVSHYGTYAFAGVMGGGTSAAFQDFDFASNTQMLANFQSGLFNLFYTAKTWHTGNDSDWSDIIAEFYDSNGDRISTHQAQSENKAAGLNVPYDLNLFVSIPTNTTKIRLKMYIKLVSESLPNTALDQFMAYIIP